MKGETYVHFLPFLTIKIDPLIRFTQPPEDKQRSWDLQFNPAVHGKNGPLNTSFAGFISPGDLAMQKVGSRIYIMIYT